MKKKFRDEILEWIVKYFGDSFRGRTKEFVDFILSFPEDQQERIIDCNMNYRGREARAHFDRISMIFILNYLNTPQEQRDTFFKQWF